MRVALTGCATGIGAATARKLKKQGHHVTAFDRVDPGDDIDQWISIDLSDPASIETALAESSGSYDALINNAGIPPKEGATELVLNVNFIGLRHFMQGMLDQLNNNASIVNTASKAGAHWRENLDEVKSLLALNSPSDLAGFIREHKIDYVRAYNLSKEALIVLTMAETKNMAARGFRINSVSPAAVSTEILDDFINAFGDRVAKNLRLVGRPGSVEEIADVIVFIATPASHWINGADIVVDGGMSAMLASDELNLQTTGPEFSHRYR